MVHMSGDAGLLDGPVRPQGIFLNAVRGFMSPEDQAAVRARAALAGMVWSHPSIQSSWYRNRAGRVPVLSPWRLLDYRQWTQAPDPQDFHLS